MRSFALLAVLVPPWAFLILKASSWPWLASVAAAILLMAVESVFIWTWPRLLEARRWLIQIAGLSFAGSWLVMDLAIAFRVHTLPDIFMIVTLLLGFLGMAVAGVLWVVDAWVELSLPVRHSHRT